MNQPQIIRHTYLQCYLETTKEINLMSIDYIRDKKIIITRAVQNLAVTSVFS